MTFAFRCSGDIPGGHVDCDFTCETEEEAFTHFERTTHSVDAACMAVDCDEPYHTFTYDDSVPAATQPSLTEETHIVQLTLTRIPLNGFNDPNATPCAQLFEACDQIATIHMSGETRSLCVDVCPTHAAQIVLAWGEENGEMGTFTTPALS